MSKDEAAIEAEIQAKGLNAPRLNPQMIDETIVSEQYHVFPGTTMTICALSLRNGFIVTGESAAASPANFDPAIGPARLLYAFEAVIIGGLGSLWGTLAGGLVIGVAQAMGAAINPEWQILAGHIAFVAVLLVRPRGLFPRAND